MGAPDVVVYDRRKEKTLAQGRLLTTRLSWNKEELLLSLDTGYHIALEPPTADTSKVNTISCYDDRKSGWKEIPIVEKSLVILHEEQEDTILLYLEGGYAVTFNKEELEARLVLMRIEGEIA